MRNKKSGFTLFELIIAIIFIVVILGVVGCSGALIFVGCKATRAVQEDGFKGVASQIYHGSNTNSNN